MQRQAEGQQHVDQDTDGDCNQIGFHDVTSPPSAGRKYPGDAAAARTAAPRTRRRSCRPAPPPGWRLPAQC
ncbi:hypothetical protein G6F40_017713 [Rhizopus arrhizus]|nr:hypothetical protein G6F40_017713 [Rhizopus arrhizus]KAG1364598.1 hypothetical protein G6F59_018963 [Rhizopus arrhizus]